MYEAFYGLSTKPFQLNPDPSFYYSSKPHRRARSYLEYGVMRNEGFIVITGEVGAGKTTIVRGLLDSLDDNAVIAAHLVSTQLGAEDTLRLVGAAFGVRVKDMSKAELIMALEAYFITQTTQGKRCLLVVDEAQNLRPQAVEELRMLSNFQYGQQALLQTFLVGQPEFRDILQSPGMLQLRQRVTASCHLGPLDEEETELYIKHRLKCAGATTKPTFEPGVFKLIYGHTSGIPRRINSMCDRLLLSGFLGEVEHFTEQVVQEVIDELRAENAAPTKSPAISAEPLGDGEQAAMRSALAAMSADDSAGVGELDLDLSALENLTDQLSRVSTETLSARLLRIERSLLRQERVSLEILVALQKIVSASRKLKTEDAAR